MPETLLSDLSVRPATAEDRPTVERLWLLFRHDLSGFRGVLPGPGAEFRSERLDSAFAEAGWVPYLMTCGEHPVGFAFVRGPTAPTRVLNSFFVVRGARRAGVGLRAVREILARHPGRWEIAFQHDNAPAVSFWHRVAREVAGDAWEQAVRPVPGRPELPPDVWISFVVPR
ncbi:GNAT family N-acetyltransferase [Streptomyces sp. NBC_00820]|uniref:GNAT family N-acetyltransferase n=1 Tax=Streptomyces sp. NBC_00820 TaxID=2975842 RepID=UPI002ED47B6C|nr:GNAT family N-acetyltransferase [Streptomyces sp. NBC_00820]